MAFDGTEGDAIAMADGSALTKEYRDNNPGQIKARFFGKDVLQEILNQPDCMGIRAYFAVNEDGENEYDITLLLSHDNIPPKFIQRRRTREEMRQFRSVLFVLFMCP